MREENIEYNIAHCSQVTFELTDDCNLNCKYCAYGEFYSNFDQRKQKYQNFNNILSVINYLKYFKNSSLNKSINANFNIGFYGGEPLLNFKVIKETVEFINDSNPFKNTTIEYGMTTNGILLDKYIDFFVKNNFRLLISLDGDKIGNQYRLDKNKHNAFEKIYNNCILIKNKYPEYYDKHVSFNAVLHNQNSIESIYTFFNENLNKTPQISEISDIGIAENKKEEFLLTYKNYYQNFHESKKCGQIELIDFMSNPDNRILSRFVHFFLGLSYVDYFEAIEDRSIKKFIPTGTCLPFLRRFFVTVNNKILPCERIGHNYLLGSIVNNKVEFDFKEICLMYNNLYDEIVNRWCKKCYNLYNCGTCIFTDERSKNCANFMNKKDIISFFSECFTELENKPELYSNILNNVKYE